MTTEEWEIDTMHSGIYFSVKHMLVGRVRGGFERWTATFVADATDVSRSVVEVVIDAASIHTGVAARDAHLRSPVFLDAKNHPTMHFKSEGVQRLDGDHFRLTGNLTIRGVTREVVIDAKETGRSDEYDGIQRAGFTATTSFDRKDFGITRDDAPASGMLIGARVDIEIEIEATRRFMQTATGATTRTAVGGAAER